MDFSKHPIYSADYLSAVIIAIALTIAFAGAMRQQNYRAWRSMMATSYSLAIAIVSASSPSVQ
jgi:hypothetical protein